MRRHGDAAQTDRAFLAWCHRGVGTRAPLPLDRVTADIGKRQPATWVLLPRISLSHTLGGAAVAAAACGKQRIVWSIVPRYSELLQYLFL